MRINHGVLTFLLHTSLAFVISCQECSDKGTISTVTANLTCDYFLEIYADGRLVGRNENYSAANTYIINPGVDVIALKCRILDESNSSSAGGILGSFSNGLVTDLSWKCTVEFERGWNTGNYVDKHWAHAKSYTENRDLALPWGPRKNVPQNAHWIWTQDNKNDTTVYCRHKLVEKCTKVKNSFFHTELQYTDRSLDGFVVKTTYTDSEIQCGLKCGQLKECVSFNMQTAGETPAQKKMCELSRATRNTAQLVKRKGFQYYELAEIFY